MILMILDTILVFVFFDGLDTFIGLILSYGRNGLDSFLVLIWGLWFGVMVVNLERKGLMECVGGLVG